MEGDSNRENREIADRLITRLREFAQGLPEGERRGLALLLAPGIEHVYELLDEAQAEVSGFGSDATPSLAVAIGLALRESHIEVRGLSPDDGAG